MVKNTVTFTAPKETEPRRVKHNFMLLIPIMLISHVFVKKNRAKLITAWFHPDMIEFLRISRYGGKLGDWLSKIV